MAEITGNKPTPIRPDVEIPSSPDVVSFAERYIQTLVNIIGSLAVTSKTRDIDQVREGIEDAIQQAGLPPEQHQEAVSAFLQFTNAMFDRSPVIIRPPRLRAVEKGEE